MKSYEELERELIEAEEAEEEAFRQISMVKGECRWGRQSEGSKCRLRKKGVCGEDDFPCSYRGRKIAKSCRLGYSGENCNFDYHGVCGVNGRRCSLYE